MKALSILGLALLTSCVVTENGSESSSKNSGSNRKCYYNEKKVSCKEFDRIAKKDGKNISDCSWHAGKSKLTDVREIEQEVRKKGFVLNSAYKLCENSLESDVEFAKITKKDVTQLSEIELQEVIQETQDVIEDLNFELSIIYNALIGNDDLEAKLELVDLGNKLNHLDEMRELVNEDLYALPEVNIESLDQYTIPENLVK